MDKSNYNRIAEDKSQLYKFVDEVCEGGGVSIFDMTEAQAADQSVLAQIYSTCPMILRVTTATDGIQMYRLQYDMRKESNLIVFTCFIEGLIIKLELKEKNGAYSIETVNYPLTPAQQ